MTKSQPQKEGFWSRYGQWLLAILAIIIPTVALIFGEELWQKVSTWQKSKQPPSFTYIFEGAFDQKVSQFEVAFPLGWTNQPKSNARIVLQAEYSGKEYDGPAYIKIKKANGDIVVVGQWEDFAKQSSEQKMIPLDFITLFDIAGLEGTIANLDITSEDPLQPIRGQFDVFVENQGTDIPGSRKTVTVLNTGWFHRIYLSDTEIGVGKNLKAYVQVINYGADSDFAIASCAYRVTTGTFQPDLSTFRSEQGIGWWPEQSLMNFCGDNYDKTALFLEQGSEKAITLEIPNEATTEPGAYVFAVYAMKKLPILDYGNELWTIDWHSRDNRQYAAYMVLGK